jgi:transposase
MPKALSIDLRERVIAAVEAGASCRQAAARFGVGAATAIRWQARFRQEGEIAPGRWAEIDARTASRHTRP